MKKLSMEQMENVSGGLKVPKWLECTAAGVGTILFFGSIFVTTGPISFGIVSGGCELANLLT